MRKLLVLGAVAVLLSACGGKKEQQSTTETPQGAARLWLKAAVDRDDARVQELSAEDFKEQAASLAAQVRERVSSVEYVRWGGSGAEGSEENEYSWTAVADGATVFFKVRRLGEKDYRVSEVSTSW
jgi:hypothetical protein